MALVDTTPPFQSQYFLTLYPILFLKNRAKVFLQIQQQVLGFAQNLGGDGNTIVVSPPILDTLVCTRNPIKVLNQRK